MKLLNLKEDTKSKRTMTSLIKRTLSSLVASIMLATMLTVPLGVTANAEELVEKIEGDYNKYYSDLEMSRAIFPGYSIVSSNVSSVNKHYFNYCTEVAREKYGIPNEMNCTLVCITNLVIHYRKVNDMPTPESCYGNIYKDIETYATRECGYSSTKGLNPLMNKVILKAAMERWGFKNVNADTFSNMDSFFLTSSVMRDSPYILSSTSQNHSIVIYASETLETIAKDPTNGLKYGSYDPKLYAYDPSGYKYFLNGSDIVNAKGIDLEQIMYVKSYERDPKGDVNGDGYVNLADVATLRQYIMKDPVYINKNNADVYKDNVVDITDLTFIALYLLEGEWN